jgi:hypothetical protein
MHEYNLIWVCEEMKLWLPTKKFSATNKNPDNKYINKQINETWKDEFRICVWRNLQYMLPLLHWEKVTERKTKNFVS